MRPLQVFKVNATENVDPGWYIGAAHRDFGPFATEAEAWARVVADAYRRLEAATAPGVSLAPPAA